MQDAVALLASLGHELVEAEPAIDGDALARSYLHLYFARCRPWCWRGPARPVPATATSSP